MEQLEENIREKLNAWSSTAWGNKEIMLCLGVCETSASKIHQEAKRHHGLYHSAHMKTKVKADAVCDLVGIDRKAEIKKLLECLSLMRKENKEEE